MDVLTREQRSRNMSAIKSANTKSEVLLRKALWSKGFRYRKNSKSIIGKPDVVFIGKKLAVFIDGEFFHGKNWSIQREKIGTNREFWIRKIDQNIRRDKLVSSELEKNGWSILRFWDKDVKKNVEGCVSIIANNLKKNRSDV